MARISANARQVGHSSEISEWVTPPSIVELARIVLGCIDLDPASSERANTIVQATKFYNEEQDGLTLPWNGSIWCNMPYGFLEDEDGKQRSSVQIWLDKAWAELDALRMQQGIFLVNSSTDRTWFHPLWDLCLCFPYKRIRFLDPVKLEQTKQPAQANTLAYFGDPVIGGERFADTFTDIGRIVRPDQKLVMSMSM